MPPLNPVTAWRLNKDRRLKQLLLVLLERFDVRFLRINPDDPDHPLVIRLTHAGIHGLDARLHVLGQESGHFGLELGFPDLPGNAASLVTAQRDDLAPEQALELLAIHFDLLPSPNPLLSSPPP